MSNIAGTTPEHAAARQALAVFGSVSRQEPIEWAGESPLALAASGSAWARWDDPFTEDWALRPESTGSVVKALETVLGDHDRAVTVARTFGYYQAG